MEALAWGAAIYLAMGLFYSFSTYREFKKAYKDYPVEGNKLSAKDLIMMCLLWPLGLCVEITRSM